MPEDWKLHAVVELLDHPVEFYLHCGCTKLTVAQPAYLVDRLGRQATIADAERRMKCGTCRRRPRLEIGLQWAVSGGRDKRIAPPPLPDWLELS